MKKISVKRLRDMLEQVVVHNDHGLFKHVRPVPPVLSYTKQDRHWSACWRVWRAGLVVDPEAHWHDNHAKTFIVSSAQEKAEQFAAAKDWASERYGYTTDEWVKTPYGSWAPRTGLEAALRHHLPHLFVEEGENTTSIEPSGVRETTIHIPGDPVVKRITDKLYSDGTDEVIKKIPSHGDVLRINGLTSIEDSDVRTAALDAYSEEWEGSRYEVRDHQRALRAAVKAGVEVVLAHLNSRENDVDDHGADENTENGALHWYEVRGANVAVFVQALDEHDARSRVRRMINRMTMDCSLELHITKRDPKMG